MEIQSLGYRTDLMFPSFEGIIIDRDDYLVVQTPLNPTFYWGNFLLFKRPPGDGDYSRWQDLFVREIGSPPRVRHQAFGWDGTSDEKGAIQPFLDDGFHLEHLSVLTARPDKLQARSSPGVALRPLISQDDWEQSIENQVICREPFFSETGYRTFRQGVVKRYRQMVDHGLGAWFGAFSGNRLVADLGLFHTGKLGRYQSVQTHPDFRRRGIAAALVKFAAQYALETFDLETLIIVADTGSSAQRLYLSMGFKFTEYQLGISKSDETP